MAARAYFREIQAGDITHVAEHMREPDREEIFAMLGPVGLKDMLARAVLLSDQCWTWAAPDREPIAIFGVAPTSLLEGVGAPWLLGTDRVLDYPGVLVREGRSYVARMLARYPHLENFVDARNERSVRWLERLGFKVYPAAPMGVAGLPFHRFEMSA